MSYPFQTRPLQKDEKSRPCLVGSPKFPTKPLLLEIILVSKLLVLYFYYKERYYNFYVFIYMELTRNVKR